MKKQTVQCAVTESRLYRKSSAFVQVFLTFIAFGAKTHQFSS
ncbi:hypothetical protein [uncultured Gilvimarinus sp.]